MASSSLTTLVMKEDGGYGNWADLPSELTSSVLSRLNTVDILENAQKVCTSWRRLCKDPALWRKIDMRNFVVLLKIDIMNREVMCRNAVDRSLGGLLEIDIWNFGTDKLLNYIADRSSNLRILRLAMCDESVTDDGFTKALVKLPLLEELEVSYSELSAESLRVVGHSCPNLTTLKLNQRLELEHWFVNDRDALAIALTMPRLRHLQLVGNKLSNAGLTAILHLCPDLVHLDLRCCYNVQLFGDLETRCLERIKVLRRPYDSTHDFPYFIDFGSSSEDD
ncbi:F-box protein SKIP19 [Raphanus sativus]|nr:F-box protein SKIP19 [Raphanus sativus]